MRSKVVRSVFTAVSAIAFSGLLLFACSALELSPMLSALCGWCSAFVYITITDAILDA